MSETKRRSAAGAAPGFADWQDLVEKALKGRGFAALRARSRDGFRIEPLYQRRRESVSLPRPGTRSLAIVQAIDDPDPDRANAQAREDIAGGATGLSLRFADAPSAAGFGLPASAEALATALDGIDLAKIHFRIEPHAGILQSALWLKEHVAKSGIAPERADIAFGLDPVAVIAQGNDARSIDPRGFAARFNELRVARFRGPLARLDARVFHEAGADDTQELAAILGAASWWLRTLAGADVPPAAALPLLGASIAVDRDIFLSIAKLRALRILWARLEELCSAPLAPLQIHAETSRRMLTRADPATNLLRNTIAAFAAAVGGADSIAVTPHTAALGLPAPDARALARNVPHLLVEEADLTRVADPATGSGALEALTDALAGRAWSEFQEIEREGGIIESLGSSAFQSRIATSRAALISEVASGTVPLVGATIHPSPEPTPPSAPRERETGAMNGLAPVSLEALVTAAA